MKDFDDEVYQGKFALTLKVLRLSNGLTQYDLAKKLNVTPSIITMYENGSRNPSLKMLTKLANFFDISIDELINSSTKRFNNTNEAFLGISSEEFNKLTNDEKQMIREFITFIKNKHS